MGCASTESSADGGLADDGLEAGGRSISASEVTESHARTLVGENVGVVASLVPAVLAPQITRERSEHVCGTAAARIRGTAGNDFAAMLRARRETPVIANQRKARWADDGSESGHQFHRGHYAMGLAAVRVWH